MLVPVAIHHACPPLACRLLCSDDPGLSSTGLRHSHPQVPHEQPQVPHEQPRVQHKQPQVPHPQPRVQHEQPQVPHEQPQVQHKRVRTNCRGFNHHRDWRTRVPHKQPQVPHSQPNPICPGFSNLECCQTSHIGASFLKSITCDKPQGEKITRSLRSNDIRHLGWSSIRAEADFDAGGSVASASRTMPGVRTSGRTCAGADGSAG
jgi:hypothetical protein